MWDGITMDSIEKAKKNSNNIANGAIYSPQTASYESLQYLSKKKRNAVLYCGGGRAFMFRLGSNIFTRIESA